MQVTSFGLVILCCRNTLSRGEDSGPTQTERCPLPRQQISLPTLLILPGSKATPTINLTRFQDTLTHSTDHTGISLSVRASRGSDVNKVEFTDPSDPTDLGPDIQRILFTESDDDFGGIQVTRV